jgi:hypothetical protein
VKRRVLLLAAIVALIAGAAFFGGYRVGARPASSARHAYTLRDGDSLTVPAVKVGCNVYSQYDQPDTQSGPSHLVFYCRPGTGPNWVVFLRNRTQVWKASSCPSCPYGNNNHPVWSGKP